MQANTLPEQPSKVSTAVYLLYLGLAIGLGNHLIHGSLVGSVAGESIGPREFVTLLIISAIHCWLYYMIGKGRNWARITALIPVIPEIAATAYLVILSLSQTPLSEPVGIAEIFLGIVTRILEIVAMVFLFQRDSSDWFKAMKLWRRLQKVC